MEAFFATAAAVSSTHKQDKLCALLKLSEAEAPEQDAPEAPEQEAPDAPEEWDEDEWDEEAWKAWEESEEKAWANSKLRPPEPSFPPGAPKAAMNMEDLQLGCTLTDSSPKAAMNKEDLQ